MTIWSLTENPKIFWHFHGLSSCQCENSGWYFPLEAKFDFKSSDFALNSKLVTYLQWETALFKINIIWSPLIRRSTSALSTTRVGYCQILQKYQILVGGVMQIKNGWVGYLLPKSEKGHLVQTAFEGFCKNILGWKRTKTVQNAMLCWQEGFLQIPSVLQIKSALLGTHKPAAKYDAFLLLLPTALQI